MAKGYSKVGVALVVAAVVVGVSAGLAFNKVESKASTQAEVQTPAGSGIVSSPGSESNPEPTISVVPPTIPADHVGRTACRVCHEAGLAGAPQFPASHVDRTDAQCPTCHRRGT